MKIWSFYSVFVPFCVVLRFSVAGCSDISQSETGNATSPVCESLIVPNKSHSFGFLPPGRPTTLSFDFPIKNAGREPIEILSISRSCRTTAACPMDTILPGALSYIRIKAILPSEYAHDKNFSRHIKVETNAHNLPQFELSISATFDYTVEWEPKEISFGPIRAGEITEKKIILTSRSSETLVIKPVVYNESLYAINIVPAKSLPISEDRASKPFMRSMLCLSTIRDKIPEGFFLDTLVLSTNHEDIPIIRVPVSGYFAPAINIEPREIFLGVISKGDTIKRSIHVSSPIPDFSITKVTSSINGLRASIKIIPNGYAIDLSYQASLSDEIIDGNILVFTNLASFPEVQLRVMGLVK